MFIFMQILVTDLTLQRQSCSFNCEFKYKKKTVLFLGQKTDATLNSEGNWEKLRICFYTFPTCKITKKSFNMVNLNFKFKTVNCGYFCTDDLCLVLF